MITKYSEFLLEKKNFETISKPDSMKDKLSAEAKKALDGVSLGKDKKGYFVYTHRWRSKSYESPESITEKDIIFGESTG